MEPDHFALVLPTWQARIEMVVERSNGIDVIDKDLPVMSTVQTFTVYALRCTGTDIAVHPIPDVLH